MTRLSFWFHKQWYKLTHKLTPKGEQFKQYCKDRLSGKDIQINEEFEKLIDDISVELKIPKDKALYFYYEFMDGIYK